MKRLTANTIYDLADVNKQFYDVIYIGFLLNHLCYMKANITFENITQLFHIPSHYYNDLRSLFKMSFDDIKNMPFEQALIYSYWYGCFNEITDEIYEKYKNEKDIFKFHKNKFILGSRIYQSQINRLAAIKAI